MPHFGKWFRARDSSNKSDSSKNSENMTYSAEFYDDTHLGYGVESSSRPIIEEPPDETDVQRWAHGGFGDGSERSHRDYDDRSALSLWNEANFGDPFSVMRGVMSEIDSVFRNLGQHFDSFEAGDNLLSEGVHQGFAQSTRTIRRQRPDGSVYEETVTTRRGPDGTVEETRTVRDSSTGENRSITNYGAPPKALEGQPRRGPRIEECPDGDDL
ncbi:hypothetical protein CCYA_CCYA13G3608 [Cyanidiococcus yangmingshanensis]|nr:hypothetical protein CCYA_CCYA13G3608 [Cyanidiococcus yangmingshanensis]